MIIVSTLLLLKIDYKHVQQIKTVLKCVMGKLEIISDNYHDIVLLTTIFSSKNCKITWKNWLIACDCYVTTRTSSPAKKLSRSFLI